jgi:hypothetical protein
MIAVYSFSDQPNNNSNEPKAAIIDQLSSSEEFTNATFVNTVTNMLTTAGYQVTYYKGSDIDVNFYQTLPRYGYKILLFRVHSALHLDYATGNLTSPLVFFTSENYTKNAYVTDQLLNELEMVAYNASSKQWYFGIPPGFIMDVMEGYFPNAIIILEGCNGLDGLGRSETMLQALVYKGASVIVGWNASVSMSHTDIGVEDFLHAMLVENETVKEAVKSTNSEIAPDSFYENELLYYPSRGAPFYCGPDAGNYTIPRDPSKSGSTETSAISTLSSANESVLAVPLLLLIMEPCAFQRLRKKTSSVFQDVSTR